MPTEKPSQKAPFDHSAPLDIMAEHFRKGVCGAHIAAMRITVFNDLDAADKLGALIGGTLTGLVGSVFASIAPECRDQAMKAIGDLLPFAREQAESILDEAPHVD